MLIEAIFHKAPTVVKMDSTKPNKTVEVVEIDETKLDKDEDEDDDVLCQNLNVAMAK